MEFLFNIQVDCESTQRTINNPALGERAVRGLGEIFAETGLKATFVVIPPDLRAHAALYRALESQGHEIGLHTHPAEQGYEEFLGVYGFDDQKRIIGEGAAVFADALGHAPGFHPRLLFRQRLYLSRPGSAWLQTRHSVAADTQPATMRVRVGQLAARRALSAPQ